MFCYLVTSHFVLRKLPLISLLMYRTQAVRVRKFKVDCSPQLPKVCLPLVQITDEISHYLRKFFTSIYVFPCQSSFHQRSNTSIYNPGPAVATVPRDLVLPPSTNKQNDDHRMSTWFHLSKPTSHHCFDAIHPLQMSQHPYRNE